MRITCRWSVFAKRATAEMATLRGELETERAATRQYKAELFRLRKTAETRVAAGVAAVTSAADSAKDAAAIRADVIKRATAAEGHAAAFYRRAIEAERLLRVERDRNNSLVAALNAAGTAAERLDAPDAVGTACARAANAGDDDDGASRGARDDLCGERARPVGPVNVASRKNRNGSSNEIDRTGHDRTCDA